MAERPKPGRRRERKVIGQTTYLRCYGPFHDGEWLSTDRFTKIKGMDSWTTYCRECKQYIYVKRNGGNGEVKLATVRKWLEEVVDRCGTNASAARTLGVPVPQLYRWLGRYRGYEQTRINRKSVKLILDTLGGLRNGTITPSPTRINHGRKYKYGCSGCGRRIDEDDPIYTPGCKPCENRKYYASLTPEMKLAKHQRGNEHAKRKRRERREKLTAAA